MKNLQRYLIAAVISLALFLPNLLSAQTLIPFTSFSSAVTSTSTTTVAVASATGITAGSTALFANGEMMFVNAVNGTTLSVGRGYFGTRAVTHNTTSMVWVGPPNAFQFANPEGYPAGTCTRSNQLYLPWINTYSGQISDCLGGVWISGTQNVGHPSKILAPNSGGTAYTSLDSTGTAGTNTSMFCTEIDIPSNMKVTGLASLNGTGVANGNRLVVLYDSTGNLLAHSATAGVATATVSVYQQIAFTTPYYAVGPALYLGCIQQSSSSDTVRMIVAGTQDTYITGAITGQTFGTIPATITAPTTFTTVTGPYFYAY